MPIAGWFVEELPKSNSEMPRTKQNRKPNRAGVATVEMAIVLPVFIVLVFGSIEVCQRLHTKQSAIIAAYEACRVASRPIGDTATVQTQCETLLTQQGVVGATVTIVHRPYDASDGSLGSNVSGLDGISTGDEIRVRVVVPWAENVVSRYVVSDQGNFTVNAFMLRE